MAAAPRLLRLLVPYKIKAGSFFAREETPVTPLPENREIYIATCIQRPDRGDRCPRRNRYFVHCMRKLE